MLFSLAFVGTGLEFVPQYSSIVQFSPDPLVSLVSKLAWVEANAFFDTAMQGENGDAGPRGLGGKQVMTWISFLLLFL